MSKVYIFDTTLRDGEQSPGAILKPSEKLKIAYALEELGVDVIEAGFPVSSPGDFRAVKTIARKVRQPVICALARMIEKDIRVAGQAVKLAKRTRIHVFIGTSDIHLKEQLKKSREDVLEIVAEGVKLARSYTRDVEFSPMDATRTDVNFLCKVLTVAIGQGATTLNIPDTVGYALPWEMERLIKKLKNQLKALIRKSCQFIAIMTLV